MKKYKYSVPKGYKGITNDIILEFNTNLAVITGLNGSGKSTILKYLYENYPDRSKCFIKTLQSNDERKKNTIYSSGLRSNDDISFERVMEDIVSIGLRRRGRVDLPFLDRTDFYSSLFDQDSIYYQNGYAYLEAIAKLLTDYQFDELDNIKSSLGIVTEKDIDQQLVRELNQNNEDNIKSFGIKRGRTILEKFNSFGLNEEQNIILRKKKKIIEERLKIDLRKNSKIYSEEALKSYVYDLLTREFRSIESIVHKMSNKIFQDFKTKNSRRKIKKLWEQINDELQKYSEKGYFKYKLVPPKSYESYYEIAFEHFNKNSKTYIHFDSLSSGEKIIFELICYYFAAKESKLEMIMLDEFDANLNPLLAERYIAVIKEQFKNINVVLTTHSPSTVVEVEPTELFELTDSRELKCASNEGGKRDILKRLAPKFVYHGEFGILEDVFNNKYELIIFVEGKNDVKNFDSGITEEKYKFIDSRGVGNMPDLVKIFKVIPFFQKLAEQKQIVFLFDFDKEGTENMVKCLHKDDNQQSVYEKFAQKKYYCKKIESELKIYVSHLIPYQTHSWNTRDEYRHQELKQEGNEGIGRQFDLLKRIKSGYFDLIEST
ncbi:AAA family ATPase [Chryseobacterium nepalense]|uniref:AAA family ATPase n=1 Tax=Chryseobacterium nepalense TaxID=1854498 RepID=UPI002E05E4EC|nr:ABC-type Mn2+/Zn2+ transport system ATPase subunit/5S rRNA maturation endonuclease (ribonuclease M5) [Chryseobacterium nepalense]